LFGGGRESLTGSGLPFTPTFVAAAAVTVVVAAGSAAAGEGAAVAAQASGDE
jgi:hypothetical protein